MVGKGGRVVRIRMGRVGRVVEGVLGGLWGWIDDMRRERCCYGVRRMRELGERRCSGKGGEVIEGVVCWW